VFTVSIPVRSRCLLYLFLYIATFSIACPLASVHARFIAVRRKTRHTHKHTTRTTQHPTRQEQQHNTRHDKNIAAMGCIYIFSIVYTPKLSIACPLVTVHAAHELIAGLGFIYRLSILVYAQVVDRLSVSDGNMRRSKFSLRCDSHSIPTTPNFSSQEATVHATLDLIAAVESLIYPCIYPSSLRRVRRLHVTGVTTASSGTASSGTGARHSSDSLV